MHKQVRIAARLAATELTSEEIGLVSGGRIMAGGQTVVNDQSTGTCHLDTCTDCWIGGGEFAACDDAG